MPSEGFEQGNHGWYCHESCDSHVAEPRKSLPVFRLAHEFLPREERCTLPKDKRLHVLTAIEAYPFYRKRITLDQKIEEDSSERWDGEQH